MRLKRRGGEVGGVERRFDTVGRGEWAELHLTEFVNKERKEVKSSLHKVEVNVKIS